MAELITFQAVSRGSTLTKLIIDQIESMIAERHLTPGDRLPSERDLALQFNVSRTVIREAVAALSAKSLLEALPNGGAIVRSPSAESVSQSLAMYLNTGTADLHYGKVHEVRRLLEVEIASLAAVRRTEADLMLLEHLVNEATRGELSREQFVKNDTEFHAGLARSTQNELFVLLMDSLSKIMLKVLQTGYEITGATGRAAAHHRAIYDCIVERDSSGAAREMSYHLQEAEETQAQFQRLHG